MILHIFESGRHVVAPKFWAGWSAAAHAAVVAGVVGGAYRQPAKPRAPDERARYILPRLPGMAPAVAVEGIQWVGLGGRPAPGGLAAPLPSGAPPQSAHHAPRRVAGAAPRPEWLQAAADTSDAHATLLYLADQVDAEVTRDASSEGPHYPDSLQVAGVEGSVTAEWVVDSAGHADTATFRALAATHPLFEAAVREVLPRMRFHAATAGGVAVAQLVRQGFQFRMVAPAPSPKAPGPR